MHSKTLNLRPKGLDQDERPGVPLLGLEVSGFNPTPDPHSITGEQCLLNRDDRVPDRLPSVAYYQVRRAPPPPTYEKWMETQERKKQLALRPPTPPPPPEPAEGEEGEGEEVEERPTSAKSMAQKSMEPEEPPIDPSIWTHDMSYDDFHSCFEQVNLGDMVGSKSWQAEVQGVLWRYFDLLAYIMYFHGGPAAAAAARGGGGATTPGAAAAADGRDHELMTISIYEFRVFVRKAALTSPFLNVAQMDLIIPTHDGKRRVSHTAVHHPEGRVTLSEFMEALVRISISRQANIADPEIKLPNALIDIVEQHLMPAYGAFPPGDNLNSMFDLDPAMQEEVEPGMGTYKVLAFEELDGSIGRVMRIHAPTTRALFAKFAVRDDTGSAMEVREFFAMCRAGGLLEASASDARSGLTSDDVVELFAGIQLGGHSATALEKWKAKYLPAGLEGKEGGDGGGGDGGAGAAVAPPPARPSSAGSSNSIAATLANANKSVAGAVLSVEFEELIGRLALRKFQYDKTTPASKKVHEIFQLLRVSLASGARRRPGGVTPGYLLSQITPGNTRLDGNYSSVADQPFEPRLYQTSNQQAFEAKANADRVRAVDMILNKAKYEAMAAAKEAKGGDKKGGDKKGGKKKK